jgi:hypothetical protein
MDTVKKRQGRSTVTPISLVYVFSDLMFFSRNGITTFKCGRFVILFWGPTQNCAVETVPSVKVCSTATWRLPNLMWLNLASNCISSLPPEGELQGLQAHWGVGLGWIILNRVVIWCNIIGSQRPMGQWSTYASWQLAFRAEAYTLITLCRGCASTIVLKRICVKSGHPPSLDRDFRPSRFWPYPCPSSVRSYPSYQCPTVI